MKRIDYENGKLGNNESIPFDFFPKKEEVCRYNEYGSGRYCK